VGTTSPTTGRLVIAQSNSVQPAISLPTDESTIQGPSANTQIRMGGNLVLGAAGQVSVNTAGSARIVVDSSGRVTLPFQPSFCAYNTGAFTISADGVNASPYSGSAFNATQFNVGSCYNTSNNRFTAPIAGKYLFNFVIYASTDPGVVLEAKLWINAQEVRRFYNRAGGNINNESASITATMSLAAGDYVQWGVYCSAAFDVAAVSGALFNYFDGYLIG
jgi:hypothetical protein